MASIEQHNREIQANLERWNRKPILRDIYRGFYRLINEFLGSSPDDLVVELGSGIGNICDVIPGCVRTDLFPNPWIDQTENAYSLSFGDESVDGIVLFDVFHHLRYPGTALQEWFRVLKPGKRIVVFEPCISPLGRLVYGAFHNEPVAEKDEIQYFSPPDWTPQDLDYYAAQGNATRVFVKRECPDLLAAWDLVAMRRLSAISYVLSGGYASPQLYPTWMLPLMRSMDWLCDRLPGLFATRLLVVIEKRDVVSWRRQVKDSNV